MNGELQVWELIREASLLVQFVMALLVAASVASWMVIFRKRQMLARAESRSRKFEEKFWSGADLNKLYDSVAGGREAREGLEAVFEAGFREFTRQREERRLDPDAMTNGAQRAMRVTLTREMDRLEHRLSFLATVGSVSPYVGLFGTVWGIMNSFRGLAGSQQATIAMVAPGISEALIATAMGLFAAIPAVVAFNKFSNQVERLEIRYDNFKEEFASILHRQARKLQEQG
ncbi:protein TolQ [Wenzhouxiangella sediminis]|uniref:Tol-Pal system protein TolQ n=1 Tax=Wenzhouxiangella sediminis TaxID=1792836 RepID=A0A3E1K551_9GAMM|nr:protein TolQ [Wenzhouxiangella sediminis]RFF29060.1 protein TolQ [Wenzhouxiangella sediminis]